MDHPGEEIHQKQVICLPQHPMGEGAAYPKYYLLGDSLITPRGTYHYSCAARIESLAVWVE